MGAGKSARGREAAERIGRPFVDVDREIEARAGDSIAEIFRSWGEAGFREIEEEAAVEALSAREPKVIALGGGALGSEVTRRALRDRATTVLVEVDPDTLAVEIRRYVVVHDCGTVINPLILAGQIHGGVAQGIGNAFYEKLAFDDNGQLLNASLADYLLPTSLDVPSMELGHTVTVSPLNPLGIKGAGEAGAIPVGPLFVQAIEDALDLPARGIEILEIPLSPGLLWELLTKAK